MFLKTIRKAFGSVGLASLTLLAISCMFPVYVTKEKATNPTLYAAETYAGDAWTLSSTAKPYYLRDDARQSGFGKTAIYSYAHTAKGQRIALEPGENRGVFQTSRGSVVAISLGVRIPTRGRPSSFVYIGDFTDWDSSGGWTYEISDRGSFTIDRRSGGPLAVTILGGPSGTKIEIIADGETMRVTLDDLYRWRKSKMLDGGADEVRFGPEIYFVMGSAVEDNTLQEEYSFGVGNIFFKANTLLEMNDRLEPDYAALFIARGQRVADRIPIRESSYELVWNPTSGIFNIRGPGTESIAAPPAQRTESVPIQPNPVNATATANPPESEPKGFYTLDSLSGFNVLDSVIYEPQTGRITLVGHADALYSGPPIPYLDHLAELLQNPSPEFSFDWTPESQSRVKELFDKFNSEEYVKGLARQWAEIMDANGHPTGQGRWLLPMIGIKPTSNGGRLGDLGVEVREITQTQRRVYERLEIISVKPGSAAERAGLVPGDVIGNYANAASFMHDNRLRGEGAQLILQILHSGESAANMVTVTLGGMDGDPWAELDKFDIVQKMLWAAGNEKGAMLINSFAQVQRQVLSGSKAGFQTAFSILVAIAGFNDPYWQDMAEYEAGRMSQNQVLGRAYRAIFAAMEDAFAFGDRPLTNTFDATMRSEFDSSSALDRTIAVLNEQIKPLLEQVMNTLLAKNEEIQIPPDVMLKSVGPQVEVTPDYRGVDPHSALAHLLFEADYLGKSLINMPSLKQKIPRYQSDFAFERDHPDKIGPWHATADYHLWYSIESLDFAQSKDGRTLQTRGAKMRFNIREKAPDDTDIPPTPGGYEELLTSLYNDFANEFPALHELRETAKLAGAARWLKSKKPDLQLPRTGRIFWSGPDKTTGFVYLTWSPRERPGRLAMALSATGGVSLNLVKVPKDIVGIADDGSLPVVDLSKNPVWNSKNLRMPDGEPIPQPIGWATTGAKDGQTAAVSFIPPKEEDSPAPVVLETDAVENGVVLWKANDLEGVKTLLTKNVQKDRQRYDDQLQKLMNEADRKNVPSPVNTPSPVVGDRIEEGVILGLFNPESEAKSYTGYVSSFSGKALKEGAVFATTDSDGTSEVLRGFLDNLTLGEYTLNTPYGKKLIEKLRGKHFDKLIAHSNGATVAEALIRKGVITVDELNVVGGDRSLINQPGLQELIDSGKVKNVEVWNNPGDPIPIGSSCLLPTPLKPTGSFPLAADAANMARALTGQDKGRGIKVVYHTLAGEQYVGQIMRLDNFDAHSLKTYFYNIGTYFKSSNK